MMLPLKPVVYPTAPVEGLQRRANYQRMVWPPVPPGRPVKMAVQPLNAHSFVLTLVRRFQVSQLIDNVSCVIYAPHGLQAAIQAFESLEQLMIVRPAWKRMELRSDTDSTLY